MVSKTIIEWSEHIKEDRKEMIDALKESVLELKALVLDIDENDPLEYGLPEIAEYQINSMRSLYNDMDNIGKCIAELNNMTFEMLKGHIKR